MSIKFNQTLNAIIEKLKDLFKAALDKKSLIILPIAFISDHSETLVELDIEYKKLAKELGIKDYLRVPALNIDAYFIKGLADLCLKTANGNSSAVFNGSSKRLCPASFCQCINRNY
jgi:ferrochelatase